MKGRFKMNFLEKFKNSPEYKAFEKAVNEKLNLENGYVRHFAPEKHQIFDEKTENGYEYFEHIANREEREEEGVEGLLEDHDGWFADFVHDEIMDEVTELCRTLIKLERGL